MIKLFLYLFCMNIYCIKKPYYFNDKNKVKKFMFEYSHKKKKKIIINNINYNIYNGFYITVYLLYKKIKYMYHNIKNYFHRFIKNTITIFHLFWQKKIYTKNIKNILQTLILIFSFKSFYKDLKIPHKNQNVSFIPKNLIAFVLFIITSIYKKISLLIMSKSLLKSINFQSLLYLLSSLKEFFYNVEFLIILNIIQTFFNNYHDLYKYYKYHKIQYLNKKNLKNLPNNPIGFIGLFLFSCILPKF